MAYIHWDVAPNIIPGFELFRWYGLSWLIGAFAGYRIMINIYQREEIDAGKLEDLVTYIMVGAIVGARFGHILFYEPLHYWHNPIEILPFRLEPTFQFTGLAGLASHGGILGALVALYRFNRKYQLGYLWLLDRLTIAGTALGGFIRLGNLINSEIIGTPTNLPWAFVFTSVDSIPRHPAQLYEAICYFIISLLLFLVWKNRKLQQNQGFLFGMGMVLIFLQRFLMEFLKENQVSFEENLSLNMGQWLSIPLILLGLLMIFRSTRKNKNHSAKSIQPPSK